LGSAPHVPDPQLACPAAGFFPGFAGAAGAFAVPVVAGVAAAAVVAGGVAAAFDVSAAAGVAAGVVALAADVSPAVGAAGVDVPSGALPAVVSVGVMGSLGGDPPHAVDRSALVPSAARTPVMC
jgi:hypothetical protein